MRTSFLAMMIAILSGSAVLADPANRTKLDYATPLDRLPPAKSTAGNPCAAFGPGFVKVAGSDRSAARSELMSAALPGRVDRTGKHAPLAGILTRIRLSFRFADRTRMPGPSKASPFVLRRTARGLEILAFRHPLAGTQLVQGHD
jgi:hypothetical protein